MRSSRFVSFLGLLSVCAVAGTASAAAATASSGTGLGQSWPNVPDVSRNGSFHAYVFERNGIRFIQINDSNGAVRGAVAYVAGEVLTLPIGLDAGNVVVGEGGSAPSGGQSVYQDGEVSINVSGQPNGAMQLMVEPCNPLVCSVKGQ